MRPSAAQLLQHERIDLAYKVTEAEKMYALYNTFYIQLLKVALGSPGSRLTERQSRLGKKPFNPAKPLSSRRKHSSRLY